VEGKGEGTRATENSITLEFLSMTLEMEKEGNINYIALVKIKIQVINRKQSMMFGCKTTRYLHWGNTFFLFLLHAAASSVSLII
jgi:hypothetical protein